MSQILTPPQEQPEQTPEEQEGQNKQIEHFGSVTTESRIHCLTVIGQIEGHYALPPQNKTTKYEHVIPQLVAIEESSTIRGLIVVINTVGGDVEAGLAIAEMVAGMKKPTVSLVLGGGHSIGVPLAVSAKRSFIAPSAAMTVHPIRMNGLVIGVPQTFSYFEKMQERIVRFITENSRISAQRLRDIMRNTGELTTDVGTVLSGEEAVREGIIDELGTLSDALDALYGMIDQREKHANAGDAKDTAGAQGNRPLEGEGRGDGKG